MQFKMQAGHDKSGTTATEILYSMMRVESHDPGTWGEQFPPLGAPLAGAPLGGAPLGSTQGSTSRYLLEEASRY